MPSEEFKNTRGRVTPETATEYLRHYSDVPLPFDAELKTDAEIWRQLEAIGLAPALTQVSSGQ